MKNILDEKIVKTDYLENLNFKQPITIESRTHKDYGTYFTIKIDGVEWCQVLDNELHLNIIYNLLKKHVTEYMHYEQF